MSHEIHKNSFTFRHMLFHENSNLEILPGSVLYQITTAILHVYGKMHFLLMREKEFVHGVCNKIVKFLEFHGLRLALFVV